MSKYKGVTKRRMSGRVIWYGSFITNKVRHTFGVYNTEIECAKAHDLYVLKKGIKRKTNFFKKKLVQ